MSREFLQYLDIDSSLHRLDPRTKLVWLCLMSALAMIATKTSTLLAILSLIVPLFLVAKIPTNRMRVLLTLLCLTALALIPSQTFFYWGFYYGKPVHVWIWVAKPNAIGNIPILAQAIIWVTNGFGICACEEGFLNGVIATLKFSAVFLASAIVFTTTKPGDIMLILNKLRIPHKFTFTIITALRFVPIVMEEFVLTLRAQQARGLKFRKTDLRDITKNILVILSTMILNCVRRAEILSIAMETRAFGARDTRTSLKELEMTRLDKILTAAFIGIAVTISTILIIWPAPF